MAWCVTDQAPAGGFGRPMKVGKEEMMGTLAAVEQWVSMVGCITCPPRDLIAGLHYHTQQWGGARAWSPHTGYVTK
jgi:hypothetical protein